MSPSQPSTPEFRADALTELPFGLPGRIYRSPMPFRTLGDQGKLFQAYRDAQIDTVVVLVEADEAQRQTGFDLLAFYRQQGLHVIYYPIPDFTVPASRTALEKAMDEALDRARQGHPVVVHCNAGFGRTGTFMACLARYTLYLDGPQAITWVRTYIPPALENELQYDYVLSFAERR